MSRRGKKDTQERQGEAQEALREAQEGLRDSKMSPRVPKKATAPPPVLESQVVWYRQIGGGRKIRAVVPRSKGPPPFGPKDGWFMEEDQDTAATSVDEEEAETPAPAPAPDAASTIITGAATKDML